MLICFTIKINIIIIKVKENEDEVSLQNYFVDLTFSSTLV